MQAYFIYTDRLGFRTWTEADLPLAKRLWGNPQVTRYICASGTFTEEEIEARLKLEIETEQSARMQYFPIFIRATGDFVGCCGLRPHGAQSVELGFHLLPAYWGQGYASEAARAMIDYAFQTLDVIEIFAGHHPQNAKSRRVLLKLGFEPIGEEYYAPTGLNHPSYLRKKTVV